MEYAFSARFPLPIHADASYRWPIKDRHGNDGVRLSELRIVGINLAYGGPLVPASPLAEIQAQLLLNAMYLGVAERAIHPTMVGQQHLGPLEDISRPRYMHVSACEFPNDPVPWGTYSRRTLNTCMQNFVGDFAELLITRFKTITPEEIDGWGIGDNSNIYWDLWRQRPSLNCVWIVAVRRSMKPDGSRVCYWPEIEIRM